MKSKPNIMIIAGEISGDMHAAKLVSAIKQEIPEATFFGIGGDNMREAGVEVFYGVKDMAVMGLTEVLRRFSFFKKVFNHMLQTAADRKPDAVILVDYPGFNLRFARRAHKMGLKVIYYICPQVWAWNRSRIPAMAKVVDHLITIFPFEKQHFESTDLKVDFAGHPLVDEAAKVFERPAEDIPWKGEPRVAVLPGSRPHEIQRILPIMWKAATIIEKNNSGTAFIIAMPSRREEQIALTVIEKLGEGPANWSILTGKTRSVLRTARAAMVASGTATIETALMLCPMVITYRVSPLTYLLGKLLVKVDNIGMVNIVAGKQVCPEFVQNEATPEALANALEPLLSDTPQRSEMISELKEVKTALGPVGAATKAAEVVIKALLQEENPQNQTALNQATS